VGILRTALPRPRFDRYAGEGVPELREKARNGVPFEKLGDAEYYLLVDQFDRVRGRYLNRYMVGITVFRRAQWSRDELGAVCVIPYFVRDVVSQDLASVFRLTFKGWIEAEPVGSACARCRCPTP
jgi:hypothetical protein